MGSELAGVQGGIGPSGGPPPDASVLVPPRLPTCASGIPLKIGWEGHTGLRLRFANRSFGQAGEHLHRGER